MEMDLWSDSTVLHRAATSWAIWCVLRKSSGRNLVGKFFLFATGLEVQLWGIKMDEKWIGLCCVLVLGCGRGPRGLTAGWGSRMTVTCKPHGKIQLFLHCFVLWLLGALNEENS